MDTEAASSSIKHVEKHHQQDAVCYKRPSYRESRWERAVKTYTINQESKYVMVVGVPAVGATKELLQQFALYGEIEEYRHLDEYPGEEFTEAYWIKYRRIQSSRFGKQKMDKRSFFGGLLHVFYAPEYESVMDTREKLAERKRMVLKKCREYYAKDKEKSNQTKTSEVQQITAPTQLQNPSTQPNSIPIFPVTRPNSTQNIPPTRPKSTSIRLPPFGSTLLKPLQYPKKIEPKVTALPRIPTQQATLPSEIQNLSTAEVYPEQETSFSLNQKKLSVNADHKEQDKKRIIWKANVPSNPFGLAHTYTKEPGAWHPSPGAKRAPQKEDSTEDTIRKKLLLTAEPNRADAQIQQMSPLDLVNSNETCSSNQQPPPKKKRSSDGRKRI